MIMYTYPSIQTLFRTTAVFSVNYAHLEFLIGNIVKWVRVLKITTLLGLIFVEYFNYLY